MSKKASQRFEWERLAVAAARLGRNHGHLRRLCETGDVPAGMRSRRRLPSGGMGWAIRSDFTLPVRSARQPTQVRPVGRRQATMTVAGPSRIIITMHTPGQVTIDLFGSGSKGD